MDYADSSEHAFYSQVLKVLDRMFGWALAREFDAVSLEKARDAMVSGAWLNDAERERKRKAKQPEGWARATCNKAVSRIRTLFEWATMRKIVPATVIADLRCLKPLKLGPGARESE